MKKLLIASLMSITVAVAFGQGTVFFANDSGTLTSPPDRLIRSGITGLPLTGTNIQVQLYYGAAGAPGFSLVPVSTPPARLRNSTTTVPGVWSGGGDRTLAGFDFGTTVELQVRVWDIASGATFEEALSNPSNFGLIGESQVFSYQIPASAANPPFDFFMVNFRGFSVGLPEPGTFAFGSLGAAALLVFRRRK